MEVSRVCGLDGEALVPEGDELLTKEAIGLVEGAARIDRARCDLCMDCVEVCPTGALELSGEDG